MPVKNKDSILILYAILAVYLVADIVCCARMVYTGHYLGAYSDIKIAVGVPSVLLLFFATLAMYAIMILVFKKLIFRSAAKENKIAQDGNLKINDNRFFLIFFILSLSQLIYVMLTGFNKAESVVTEQPFFFQFFIIFNPNVLFPVFYIMYRKKKEYSVRFWICVLTYCAYLFAQGWSAFILSIFFYEAWFFFKSIRRPQTKRFCMLMFPLIVILLGGIAYSFVNPLKYFIRNGDLVFVSIGDGLARLTERLSCFSATVSTFQAFDKTVALYQEQGYLFTEVTAIFRMIIPSKIMTYKDFRIFNNLHEVAYFGLIGNNVSSNFGLFLYVAMLLRTNFWQFILWVLEAVIFFKLYFLFLRKFERRKGQFDIIRALTILAFFQIGYLTPVFESFLCMIFIMPVFILTGCVKFRRKKTFRRRTVLLNEDSVYRFQ